LQDLGSPTAPTKPFYDIDWILLDLTMPRLSGEEVFREMSRIRSDVRVILSSGYNEQDTTMGGMNNAHHARIQCAF